MKTCRKCGEDFETQGKLCAKCLLRLEQRLRGEKPVADGTASNPVEAQVVSSPSFEIVKGEDEGVLIPMLIRYLYWSTGGFFIGILILGTLNFLVAYLSAQSPGVGLILSVVFFESILVGVISGIIGALVGDSKIMSWSIIAIIVLTMATFLLTLGWEFAYSF